MQPCISSMRRRYLLLRHAYPSACTGASPRPHPLFTADRSTPANTTFPIVRGATE